MSGGCVARVATLWDAVQVVRHRTAKNQRTRAPRADVTTAKKRGRDSMTSR